MINKPRWEDAPAWANYLAQNSDGSWTWFENEPTCGEIWWRNISMGKTAHAYFSKDGWKGTLENRHGVEVNQDKQ